MYLQPIILFSILVLILVAIVYKIVKSDSSDQDSNFVHLKSQTGGVIDIELNDYKDQRLLEIYYSTISNHRTELQSIHSIDNAVFMRFENDKWLNIMYNSVLELFQIENSNPTTLNLEYSLNEMTLNQFWKPVLHQKLSNLELMLEETDLIMLPKDILLNFEKRQIYMCFSAKTVNQNEIRFGKEWLYIINGVEQYRKSRI